MLQNILITNVRQNKRSQRQYAITCQNFVAIHRLRPYPVVRGFWCVCRPPSTHPTHQVLYGPETCCLQALTSATQVVGIDASKWKRLSDDLWVDGTPITYSCQQHHLSLEGSCSQNYCKFGCSLTLGWAYAKIILYIVRRQRIGELGMSYI